MDKKRLLGLTITVFLVVLAVITVYMSNLKKRYEDYTTYDEDNKLYSTLYSGVQDSDYKEEADVADVLSKYSDCVFMGASTDTMGIKRELYIGYLNGEEYTILIEYMGKGVLITEESQHVR